MVRVVPKSVGQTALSGTAGTDTTIGGADFKLPDWVRSIVGMRLADVPDLPTAAQSVITQATMSDQDGLGLSPFDALAAPIGSVLGASGGNQFVGKVEVYDMYLPVKGGENIRCQMKPLVASTSAHYGTIELLLSDLPPGRPQRHIKAGTLTQDTVINAENPGTQYSISGARRIKRLDGLVAPTTLATSEGFLGRIRFSSDEFEGTQDADLTLNPVGSGLATLGIAFIAGVSHRDCEIPIQASVRQTNVLDNFRMISSADIGANVSWVSAVEYEI